MRDHASRRDPRRRPFAAGGPQLRPPVDDRLRGEVTQTLHGDEALELIDKLAVRYTGEPFPMRSGDVYLVSCTKAGMSVLPFED